MKIAQVAPLIESVPPLNYGGTERVVAFLTEALIKRGHEVTLFASGDSRTSARLVPCCAKALRHDAGCGNSLAWHIMQIEQVARSAANFDVLHFHTDYLHFPVSSRLSTPHLTTLHGRLDLPELPHIHRTYPSMPLISISNAQRAHLPNANWRATIHHGLPEEWGRGPTGPPEFLTFLGRISPEKRTDRAIEIAIRAQQKLVIAAKVDRVDEEYFQHKIVPLLDHPLVTFVGEVGDVRKCEILKRTKALLFPIDWPEPFGLVMIEALACGVPVIAFPMGSVPEIIDHGRTGFVVDSIDEAVTAVESLNEIERAECRREFERRFVSTRMAADYVREYSRLIQSWKTDSSLDVLVAK